MSHLEQNPPGGVTIPACDPLAPVRQMILACIQCGTCTGSCPNAFAMDRTPRQLWRLVLTGLIKDIFHSKTFALCSACYCCTLRCPRGLPLTEAMGALKQIAAKQNLKPYRQGNRFYKSFMQSVRRHGRVNEMEFMTLYFISMKNPLLPLKYTPLGLKLMSKGKLSFKRSDAGKPKKTLEAIFTKVAELEEQP